MLTIASIAKPLTLSTAQALLILIKKYRDSPETYALLKKLFFLGIRTPEDTLKMEIFMQDSVLEPFTVSTSPTTINEDPVRRYFETQFAWELLKTGTKNVCLDSLEDHATFLIETVPDFYVMSNDDFFNKVGNVFSNFAQPFVGDLIDCEYHEALQKVMSDKYYKGFTAEERQRMYLIFVCSYLSVVTGDRQKEPPMNAYTDGFYIPAKRGQVLKTSEQMQVKSHFFGLMKSYMPVPTDDMAWSAEPFPYVRSTERANFNPEASWVKDNFKQLVHPFICSISGTILMNLRWMVLAHENGSLAFNSTEKLQHYIQTFVPLIVFNSGSHSFHELTYPLSIPDIQDNFSFLEGFEAFNLETLFFNGKEQEMEAALEKTLFYMDRILLKKAVNKDIYTFFSSANDQRNSETALEEKEERTLRIDY